MENTFVKDRKMRKVRGGKARYRIAILDHYTGKSRSLSFDEPEGLLEHEPKESDVDVLKALFASMIELIDNDTDFIRTCSFKIEHKMKELSRKLNINKSVVEEALLSYKEKHNLHRE